MISSLRFVAIAFVTFHALNAVNGDDKCSDMVQEVMSAQLGALVPCINSLGFKTAKERAGGYNCIMKCILAKAGTLTPEGKISIMRAIGFILEQFPNEYINKALLEISKCQQYANIDVGDASDTTCVKMRPLIQCGVDFIFNICQ